MNEYYDIPSKPRISKVISIVDVLVLIAVLALGYWCLEPDFSVGINGTSPERAQMFLEILHEGTVERETFDTFFATGTRNGFVQKDPSGESQYMTYRESLLGSNYQSYDYEEKRNTLFGDESQAGSPVGWFIWDCLISPADDSMYFDNLHGFYGTVFVDTDASICTDGQFDYDLVTDLLTTEESMLMTQAAAILHNIQKNHIVGCADGVVWYILDEEQSKKASYKDTTDGSLQRVIGLGGNVESDIFVIDNTYLLYIHEGRVIIANLSDEGTIKENSVRLNVGADVLDVNYVVTEEGVVRIAVCTAEELIIFRMTGEGVEYTDVDTKDIETPESLDITDTDEMTIFWLKNGEDYQSYKIRH